jgi:glycosyltransferase involved in cell wall biosynthesis
MGSGFFSGGAPVTGSEGAPKPGSGVFSEGAPAGRFAQEIGRKMTPDVVSGSADARPPKKNPDPVSDAASSPLPKKNPDPVLAGIPDPFILYLGRVDPNKGCETLLHYFTRYAAGGRTVTLVLAGPVNMPVPDHPSIRTLGFVDDDVRESLLSRARVLVMPSPYESLSMVLLEAWNHAVPALVNARCAVLYGQVRRADGGLHYRTGGEFAAALDYLLDRPDAARTLGAQGLAYVDREYRWPTVLAKIEDVLARTGTR